MSVSLSTIFNGYQSFLANGLPNAGGSIYTYLAGTTTAATTYTNNGGSIANANPIPLSAGGTPPHAIWLTDGTAYKFVVVDALGAQVPNGVFDNVTGVGSGSNSLSAGLTSSAGTSLVGFIQAGTGAVPRTAQDKLRDTASAKDFGAVGDGVTNDTTALFNFFTACIAQQKQGYIPAGTYLVNEGVLNFDTPFTDAVFPDIFTAGVNAVTFHAAGFADAPILQFSNGTATSPAGRYWRGGSIGGITFSGSGSGSATHGMSLRGMYGTKMGWMRGNDLSGSLIYLPTFLYGGDNPDPYACSLLEWEAMEANRCSFMLRNLNYLGMDSWKVKVMSATECRNGVWYGIGSGIEVGLMTVGSCAGRAVDDGTYADALGGAPSRIRIGICELDDVEYGFRLNRMTLFECSQVRFNHRFNFSSLNPSEGYWPRIAVDLSAGTSSNISGVKIKMIHRIEAGGTKPAMGIFINGNGIAAITDCQFSNTILDNAGLGFADSDLYTSINANDTVRIDRDGRTIFDSTDKCRSYGRGSASSVVINSGFGGSTSKVSFPTVLSVPDINYNGATSTFTAPYTGLYHLHAAIPLTLAAGTLVRICFVTAAGAQCSRSSYAATAAVQTYSIDGYVFLAAGATVYVSATQSAVASSACSVVSNNDEVRFVIVGL